MEHEHENTTGHGHRSDQFSRRSYDQRYRASPALWSGNPNPQLLAEVGSLSPGAALDAGCGEGADAIWLAGQGWRVTAVDFSAVALKRAADCAAQAGAAINSRIDWLQHDLMDWRPEPEAFDLVSAQFLQLPAAQRDVVFSALARAVVPGGALLIVGHDIGDLDQHIHRPPRREAYFTAEDLAAGMLEPEAWHIVTRASRPRSVRADDGSEVTVHDAVLHAVKRH